MAPEWLTAIGTLATFIVIAASAIAALMQLRHTRSSNQIHALNELRETLESADFREARRFVYYDLPKLYEKPDFREKLLKPGPIDPDCSSMAIVGNLFENTGTLVKYGMIDANVVCDMWDLEQARRPQYSVFLCQLRILGGPFATVVATASIRHISIGSASHDPRYDMV